MTMAYFGYCHAEGLLPKLLCPDPNHALAALETLKSSSLEDKQRLMEQILQPTQKEEIISRLGYLLSSTDSRLCSNGACLFGALVEIEEFIQQLQTGVSDDNSNRLMEAIGQLLTREEDQDVVMNAAGAVASLVESPAGRQLLLRDKPSFDQVLVCLLSLLGQRVEHLVNTSALILARLSLCEMACQALLSNPLAPAILSSLVQCLARSLTDTAMNAAFAVGRLCRSERGRGLILPVAEELVYNLQAMLSDVSWPEAGQTACFALSCLATEEDGHALVLRSPSFPCLVEGLLCCLQTDNQDSAWFAAVTVKALLSQPVGVVQLRKHKLLEEQIKSLWRALSIGQELKKEVSQCLKKLERLTEPPPPITTCLPQGAFMVSWERCTPESGLEVTYSLLNNEVLLYNGVECKMTLPRSLLKPGKSLSLRLLHTTSDGDTSPCSQAVLLVMESQEDKIRPGPPQDLCVLGCTATQVRLTWVAPAGEGKLKAYQLHKDGKLIITTTELGAIVGGLSPGTQYQLAVYAVGAVGDKVGPSAELVVHTAEEPDRAPNGLNMVVLGRHELQVIWGAPLVPMGHLFNYELRMNGNLAYLGTDRAHTARHLGANTAYTCTVTAITSRGRFCSRPVTKRTARDVYPHAQRCLYSPVLQQPTQQTNTIPPVVSDVSKVKAKVTERVTKALSLPHCPQLTPSRQSWRSNHGRDRRSQHFIVSPSSGHRSSKMQLFEMAMVLVSGCDVKFLWDTARKRAGSVSPCKIPVHPFVVQQKIKQWN